MNGKKTAIGCLFVLNFFILCAVQANSQYRNQDWYWGADIGASLPTNIGRSDTQIGFADVASTGFKSGILAGWNYNPRLFLEAEASYCFLPKKNQFWNLDSKGSFSAHYQSAGILLAGGYRLGEATWQPYCGVNFGLHYLQNHVNFKSKYAGTDNDASVQYTSKEWHPGFGINLGLETAFSKNVQFFMQTRMAFIPFLKEKVVPIKDGEVVIDYITQNPHGNQNQLQISLGLKFQID